MPGVRLTAGRYGATGDGGCGFVAAHPVKNRSEDSHRCSHARWVTRVVVIVDGNGDVVQCAKRVTVFGLDSGNEHRQECPGQAVAAVFGNLQPAATGLESLDRIGMCVGAPDGE